MVAELCRRIAAKESYSSIATKFGFTRSKVAGAVYRYILGGDTGSFSHRDVNWEARLTEPYAVRKARRLSAKTPTSGGA